MKYISALCGILFSFLPLSLTAQGIIFEETPWKEVVAKAKKADKLIYLDVYATWCGPCKMMARDVFPHEEAGKKYNELFINYKVDAEKGEGISIARKYGVSSYPTNLYINPHDESVVYRIAGACGVPEFLKRADIAQSDFKDPMSWEDYQATLEKNPKDAVFLEKYMGKAERLGKNNDEAIDVYVTHHMSIPPTDSNLLFLFVNTKTFDNKGYAVLKANQARIDAMIPDPRQRFEEREKAFYFQETFKKAVASKDIKILHSIKPVLFRYNRHDTTGKWFWVEKLYYSTTQDSVSLAKVNLKSLKYYSKFSPTQRAQKDSLILADYIASIQAGSGNERQKEAQIAQQKNNPGVAQAFTYNTVAAYEASIADVLQAKKSSKRQLSEALKWAEEGLSLAQPTFPNYENLVHQKASLLYLTGKKEEASSTMKLLIDELAASKKDPKSARLLLEKIENNSL